MDFSVWDRYVADETASLKVAKRHRQELLRRDIGGHVQPVGRYSRRAVSLCLS
jgi:hypothetical protein